MKSKFWCIHLSVYNQSLKICVIFLLTYVVPWYNQHCLQKSIIRKPHCNLIINNCLEFIFIITSIIMLIIIIMISNKYNLKFPHHVTFNWYCCHLSSPTNDMLLPLCFEAAVFRLWGGNYLPFLSWDFFFNCLALQLIKLTT